MLLAYLVSALSLGAASSSSHGDPSNHGNNTSLKFDSHFDYFVFSQQWPTSVCKGINISIPHPHTCKFGANVTTWSMHGLWPTRNHTMLPNFCNNQSEFNLRLLDPIMGDLMKYWSNLYADTPLDSLWKHEWVKHGTCAASVAGFENEYHYFKRTLELAQTYNLFSILKKNGIEPRVATYQYTDVRKALGGSALLFCYYDKTIKTQYLSQIEICLSKSLEIINCPGSHQVAAHRLGKRSVTLTQGRQEIGRDGDLNRVMNYQARLSPCYDTEAISYPPLQH